MRFLLPVVLVSALASGCNVQVGESGISFDLGSVSARDEWSRTYTLPEGGRLEIINMNGGIEASASAGREVTVVAEREARAGSEEEARALLESIDMREQVTEDSVRLEARARETGRRERFSISYDLQIPAGLVVVLKTDNGRIRLENVNGQIAAETTNGAVTGEGLAGSVSVEVINGGVELDLASVTGELRLSSVNGGIEVALPADARASLEVSCINGGISVDDRFGLAASERTRRRVAGDINGGGALISASTVNGGIRITARQAS